MKPELDNNEENSTEKDTVTGDVIGDTAYSERFVLKILLKFANLDTLQLELKDKVFEGDLCTLWDMTAERDVVLFLSKHKFLNLVQFAWSTVSTPRIIEILVGIIGNMCCNKEVVVDFVNNVDLLNSIFATTHSEDRLILIQVLRLINACLFTVQESDVEKWIEIFRQNDFHVTLAFILENSSNLNLLITAVDCLNSICSKFNIENHRGSFFNTFVTDAMVNGFHTSFKEISDNQKFLSDKEELERVFAISIEITLNLSGFDTSIALYQNKKPEVACMILEIIDYYRIRILQYEEVDPQLLDIVDSIMAINSTLQLYDLRDGVHSFRKVMNIWQHLKTVNIDLPNASKFKDKVDDDEFKDLAEKLKTSLSKYLCQCMRFCQQGTLNILFHMVQDNFECILEEAGDQTSAEVIRQRITDNEDQSIEMMTTDGQD